jgi:Alanine dehydrogenase/PNT, N-terminal domain
VTYVRERVDRQPTVGHLLKIVSFFSKFLGNQRRQALTTALLKRSLQLQSKQEATRIRDIAAIMATVRSTTAVGRFLVATLILQASTIDAFSLSTRLSSSWPRNVVPFAGRGSQLWASVQKKPKEISFADEPWVAKNNSTDFFIDESTALGAKLRLNLPVPYSELTIGVVKEKFPGESRVSLTPDSVATLTKAGFNVIVEAGGTFGLDKLDPLGGCRQALTLISIFVIEPFSW